MEILENLVRTALGEIEKVFTTRTVVGDAITIDGVTLIPLISVGFGFGAGSGEGKGEKKQQGEGSGGGTGGGAWVRPVGVVVVNNGQVTVEPIRGGLSHAIEKIGQTIPETIEKSMENIMEAWRQREKES